MHVRQKQRVKETRLENAREFYPIFYCFVPIQRPVQWVFPLSDGMVPNAALGERVDMDMF